MLTFGDALRAGFRWDFFLLEPLIFVLWCYVAVALIFWGRGVFCGWLCPFGALQELANRAARRIGVPQLKVPFWLHERLRALKFVIFLGLFAVALGSMAQAQRLAEVEPFKTAIVLRFLRDWPFVAWALLLLGGRALHRAVLLPLPVPAWALRSRSRPGCGSSSGSSATGSAAASAGSARCSARCRRSSPRAPSTRASASTA